MPDILLLKKLLRLYPNPARRGQNRPWDQGSPIQKLPDRHRNALGSAIHLLKRHDHFVEVFTDRNLVISKVTNPYSLR